jgi:hypothetical protein
MRVVSVVTRQSRVKVRFSDGSKLLMSMAQYGAMSAGPTRCHPLRSAAIRRDPPRSVGI